MTTPRRRPEPDHVYEAIVAQTGIDAATLAAQLELAIVAPLPTPVTAE